ncbi:MAG TPA: cupin domain-containing protein [Candidatus Eisenbacteria bacterium]|nr:cupin domain-containing protein [Candidatus Eisenbacteria bacterium]
MEFINLEERIVEAQDKKKRKIDLFGAANFRSWMLYFVPGDGTDMHYHANPETFLVLAGSGVVKGLNGNERPIRKNDVVFLAAKDYYQITNTGTEPLVLFGNRSEAFGGPHIKADGTDRNAARAGV